MTDAAMRPVKPVAGGLRVLRLAVLLAALGAALGLSGCGEKKPSASQTAAKVNKQEITVHQINYVLQQQRGLKPDQVDEASRKILERLIDQELALQQAEEMKLDRDPRVMQQLEASRREIIARAYLEKAGEAAPKPTAEEVAKYYEEKPALFKDRRIYNLQEINIDATPEQVATLKTKLAGVANIADFVEYLKANDFHYTASQAVRAAEQLPLASLDTFAKLKDGQALLNISPTGAQVIMLVSSRSQPVSLEQARPAIEQYLLNERKRELLVKDLKALRDAAKIEYVGKYAEAAPAAGAAPNPPAAAAPAAPAASGLDASTISKGLGLK